MELDKIAKGFYNSIINAEQELCNYRMKICKECKLMKDNEIFGEVCSNSLYLNPITDEVSTSPKKGYFPGCGCILDYKTRVKNSQCPLKKW